MNEIKVSVVIPSTNDEDQILIRTIQSALNQTYQDFEVIIVGDFSSQVVAEFDSSIRTELKFIICHTNETSPVSIGVEAATGDLIFFLQPGDKYHPAKLREHVAFRAEHPDVIITYNSHFATGKEGEVLFTSQNPSNMVFAHLVTNLSVMLSDIVVRRDWILRTRVLDTRYKTVTWDIEFLYRSILEGVKVAGINRPLNYNRYDQGFFLHHSDDKFDEMIRLLEDFFTDPRCSEELRIKRNKVVGRAYALRAFQSFLDVQTSIGQNLIIKAIQLDRSILDNQAEEFLRMLVIHTLPYADNFEVLIREVIDHLPAELTWISMYRDRTVAQAYLMSSTSDTFWERVHLVATKFKKIVIYGGAHIDMRLLIDLLGQASSFEEEFGLKPATNVVRSIGENLTKIGKRREANWFVGTFFINQAFDDYRLNQYAQVPSCVFRALFARPTLLLNRGVLSIFFHSLRRL